jgi:hypothetical protein
MKSGQEITELQVEALNGDIGADGTEKDKDSKLTLVALAESALASMLNRGRGVGFKGEGWRKNTPIIRERSLEIGNDVLIESQRQTDRKVEGRTWRQVGER